MSAYSTGTNRQPKFRNQNSGTKYLADWFDIYEKHYGIRPDSPTYVAQKLDVNRIPKGNQYKSTTVERTERLKRSGIIKYHHDGTNRSGKSKSVRFVKSNRERAKKPTSQVPIINGHARKHLWEAMTRRAKAASRTKGRFCVDSRATIHLIKSTKWLSKVLNRHKAMIKDAVGKAHPSGKSGPLQITVKKRNGAY